MEWINYHHLLYFWVVAREGSVVQASKQLLLAQPTLGGQIRVLEKSLGEKLFQKSGRKLVLTDVGRVVYRYADEIFTLGREMTHALKGRSPGRPIRFLVGVADVVPKLVAYCLLLHVLAPLEFEFALIEPQNDQLRGLLHERTTRTQSELNRFLAAELSGCQVERKLAEGRAHQEIVVGARDSKADLIIMPTHGYGPFRRSATVEPWRRSSGP